MMVSSPYSQRKLGSFTKPKPRPVKKQSVAKSGRPVAKAPKSATGMFMQIGAVKKGAGKPRPKGPIIKSGTPQGKKKKGLNY